MDNAKLESLRREYQDQSLTLDEIHQDPFCQFQRWLDEALSAACDDATAMVLSTVDESLCPDSRVVLLKGIEDGAFIFYSHFKSKKAIQIQQNNAVGLNFYWAACCRQVRIRGHAQPVAEHVSDIYFSTRPRASQISALISPQSQAIDPCALEASYDRYESAHQGKTLSRPNNWGGYAIKPYYFEFWQGRERRLHHRMRYDRIDGAWEIKALAP
jgi:pyridoxamine 5'-phosphate oxidase